MQLIYKIVTFLYRIGSRGIVRAFFFLVILIACTKRIDSTQDDCFKAKILAFLCHQAVFQILDSSYYRFGENGWKDANGLIQNHVFYSQISCRDGQYLSGLASGIIGGKELNIKIADQGNIGHCAVCQALLIGPETKHFVEIAGCN